MNLKRRKKLLVLAAALLAAALVVPPFYLNEEQLDLDDVLRADLPGQFVRLADGVTHYELSGPPDGPLVVLVHGFSTPSFTWDPTVDALVQAGFRVLRYDLYGRGYSDRPRLDYDLDLFVRQLEQLLAALPAEEPVYLGGLSFGGLIAASFAGQHPEKVRGLILLDPQAARTTAEEIAPLAVPLLGEYIMAVYIVPLRLPQAQGSDFYHPERFPAFAGQYRQQMRYRGFRRAILSTLRNLVGVDPIVRYAALAQTDLPVLLIWGEEDQTVPAEGIQQVRVALPAAEFHTIPQAGHVAHYERPELVNPLLVDFLARVGR